MQVKVVHPHDASEGCGMPIGPDLQTRRRGTRFRLFAQTPTSLTSATPETVWVSPPPQAIGPGPSDARMYVCHAIAKAQPYEYPHYLPPYRGAAHPPAAAGPDGHFDHLEPGSREFLAAHVFAGVRRTLDVWEGYFGESLPWHFATDYRRLELIPYLDWHNAQCGYGFLETGFALPAEGAPSLFGLNFDVLAHEVGHSLLFALLGVPPLRHQSAGFLGFSESACDLVALVTVLHFDSVVDRLLRATQGNIYTLNELDRLGEISRTEQIRTVVSSRTMADFIAGWRSEHEISLPLTGALFDTFVEVYLKRLTDDGLIPAALGARALAHFGASEGSAEIAQDFAAAYAGRHEVFKDALLAARDYFGFALAGAWHRLDVMSLDYVDVRDAMLATDHALADGRHARIIRDNFAWRKIGAVRFGPRLDATPHETDRRDGDADRAAARPQRTWPPQGLSYKARVAASARDG
jgi:hypothetical protein